MIKQITFTFKLLKKMHDAQQSVTFGFVPQSNETFMDSTIIRSNQMLAMSGASIAVAAKLTDGRISIVVDDEFYALPEQVQRFVFFHEKGHLELDHLEQPGNGTKRRVEAFKKGSVCPNELEADAYAAEIVGTDHAVAALFYLESYYKKQMGKCMTTVEFRRRAVALLNK